MDSQPPPKARRDALDKMALVFEGGFSRDQIQPALDQAMVLYGMPVTEQNYERCGSVLVVMRQRNAVPEMDILKSMIQIRQDAPNAGMNFADGAALAATALKTGG